MIDHFMFQQLVRICYAYSQYLLQALQFQMTEHSLDVLPHLLGLLGRYYGDLYL